jgi:hypothetical protein
VKPKKRHSTIPFTPPGLAGWLSLFNGVVLLLLSLLMHARMWQVELGLRPVAAGGGEYMMALFFGLPSLLLAALLLGITVLKQAWRSLLSCAAWFIALAVLLGWLVLFLKGHL